MTNDEITRIAKQVWMAGESYIGPSIDSLARFGALVAADAEAAEREACARVCDANAKACNNNSMLRDVLAGNAAAIRARGKE